MSNDNFTTNTTNKIMNNQKSSTLDSVKKSLEFLQKQEQQLERQLMALKSTQQFRLRCGNCQDSTMRSVQMSMILERQKQCTLLKSNLERVNQTMSEELERRQDVWDLFQFQNGFKELNELLFIDSDKDNTKTKTNNCQKGLEPHQRPERPKRLEKYSKLEPYSHGGQTAQAVQADQSGQVLKEQTNYNSCQAQQLSFHQELQDQVNSINNYQYHLPC